MERVETATSPAGSRAISPLPRTAPKLTFWGRIGKFTPKLAASAGLIGAGIITDHIYNNGFVNTAKDIYKGTKNIVIGVGRGTKEVGNGFINGFKAFKDTFKETKEVEGQRPDDIHQRTSREKNYNL